MRPSNKEHVKRLAKLTRDLRKAQAKCTEAAATSTENPQAMQRAKSLKANVQKLQAEIAHLKAGQVCRDTATFALALAHAEPRRPSQFRLRVAVRV